MKSTESSAGVAPSRWTTQSGELSISSGISPPLASPSDQLAVGVGDYRLGLDDRAVGLDYALAHRRHLGQVQVLVVLDHVEALQLDLRRHPQQVELPQDVRRHPAAQEAEREERRDADQLAPERAVHVVQASW